MAWATRFAPFLVLVMSVAVSAATAPKSVTISVSDRKVVVPIPHGFCLLDAKYKFDRSFLAATRGGVTKVYMRAMNCKQLAKARALARASAKNIPWSAVCLCRIEWLKVEVFRSVISHVYRETPQEMARHMILDIRKRHLPTPKTEEEIEAEIRRLIARNRPIDKAIHSGVLKVSDKSVYYWILSWKKVAGGRRVDVYVWGTGVINKKGITTAYATTFYGLRRDQDARAIQYVLRRSVGLRRAIIDANAVP